MPGYGVAYVKCEPPSDEEESQPQLADLFINNKLSSGFNAENSIKAQNEDESSTLLHLQSSGLEELSPLAPAAPAAIPVCVKQEPVETELTLETLESPPNATGSLFLERHLAMINTEVEETGDFMPLKEIKDEPTSEGEQQQLCSDAEEAGECVADHVTRACLKNWTQRDMDDALDALRNRNMSLTKASARYGIPSTTLWQRAHRLGIDTPKKEGAARAWRDADLRAALRALRAGSLSANKASKAYGIPSSTLYKIARREGIRLAAPFNAAPVSWRRADLPRALAAIRAGHASVQRAARQYGIPTGTLYGRCKREGIELSRSNPTPWSEDAMGEALEAVRVGQMSINQAAIHYNLPYSSLYGRFKRCKYQPQQIPPQEMQNNPENVNQQEVPYYMPHAIQEDHTSVIQYPYTEYSHVDQYAGHTMYYNHSFNGIATS